MFLFSAVQFEFEMPASLANLTKLENFVCCGPRVTGALPDGIGTVNCPNIRWLIVSDNPALGGNISAEYFSVEGVTIDVARCNQEGKNGPVPMKTPFIGGV